jgi:hypothetical protein
MGTNYYWHLKPACEHCGREYPSIHIGKSSGGWCFGLHVFENYEVHEDIERYVIHDVRSLDDWKKLWDSGGYILDEYDREISVEKMLEIITERNGVPWADHTWPGYNNEADFHNRNQSKRGPNNLLRHVIESSHCIGHGEGTWDYIKGEFS